MFNMCTSFRYYLSANFEILLQMFSFRDKTFKQTKIDYKSRFKPWRNLEKFTKKLNREQLFGNNILT